MLNMTDGALWGSLPRRGSEHITPMSTSSFSQTPLPIQLCFDTGRKPRVSALNTRRVYYILTQKPKSLDFRIKLTLTEIPCYRSQTKMREYNVFIGICVKVCVGMGYVWGGG